MKFACDSCGSQYMISDDKVGPNGVKVRCKKCNNVVSVKRAPTAAPEVSLDAGAPASSARGAGAPSLEHELGNAFDTAFGAGPVGTEAGGTAVGGEGSTADLGQDWYVAIDDNQVGPLPATGVKARWESGEIGPDTLAWRPGMADWVPLSTIAPMAQYLAPVPRGGGKAAARAVSAGAAPVAASAPRTEPARAAPAANTVVSSSSASAAPAANGQLGGQGGWKPSAGSALAALASEELSSLEKPARAGQPASTGKSGSLVDRMQLPDGGVDPTNLLPLPIKGLDQTSEARLERRSSGGVGGERTEIRQFKRSAMRSVLAVGIAMLVLFGVAVAAIAYFMRPTLAPVAQAPVVPPPAAAPVPPPAVATAPAPAATATTPGPAPAPAAAPAPAPAAPVVAQASPPPPATPEPVQAAPAPAPAREAPARTSSRSRHHEAAEPPPRPARRSASQRTAAAEPPPASAPTEQPARHRKSGGDPLLDVAGDDELEKELTGGKSGKRSVYVPPAIGSDLPESVSQSQIQEAVAGQRNALFRCIEQQRTADPDAHGTLRMRWVITGDGSVREVRNLSDEFARQPVASCISGVVKGIRFPRSRTSGQEVVFPFKF